MAEQQKKKETKPTKPAEGGDGAAGSPELAKKGKKIKEDIDKLLDEIDDTLDENAEEFVKSYVQRGGEKLMPIYDHRCQHCHVQLEKYFACFAIIVALPATASPEVL